MCGEFFSNDWLTVVQVVLELRRLAVNDLHVLRCLPVVTTEVIKIAAFSSKRAPTRSRRHLFQHEPPETLLRTVATINHSIKIYLKDEVGKRNGNLVIGRRGWIWFIVGGGMAICNFAGRRMQKGKKKKQPWEGFQALRGWVGEGRGWQECSLGRLGAGCCQTSRIPGWETLAE